MANPATAFSLYDPSMAGDAGPVPAQRIPENGSLPPMPQPGVTAMSPLQQQVMEKVLSMLNEPRPQRGASRFLLPLNMRDMPTEEQKSWDASQDQAQMGIQALNSMTGMENAGWKADQSARGWTGLGMRAAEGERSDSRLGIARDREKRLSYGPAQKFETTDDSGQPMTMIGNLLPGGKGLLLTDGTIIQPTAFPKAFRMTPLAGMNEFANYNPFTGGTQGLVHGPDGQPFRPPLPLGVAEKMIGQQNARGSLEALKETWRVNQGSRLPAVGQDMVQWGGKVAPGLTKDIMSGVGADAEYTRQIDYMRDFNRNLTDYVNSKSGKQYSYMEFIRFQPLFPRIYDSEADFDKALAHLFSSIEREYGLTTQLYPGAARLSAPKVNPPAKESPHSVDKAAPEFGRADDGNKPEKQYGPETTNIGDNQGGKRKTAAQLADEMGFIK